MGEKLKLQEKSDSIVFIIERKEIFALDLASWFQKLGNNITPGLNQIGVNLYAYFSAVGFPKLFTSAVRWILPPLAVLIVYRCAKNLLERDSGEVWAYLSLPNGLKLPLYHWENTIGRSPLSDICLNYPTVSRSHAALIRGEKEEWTVDDLKSTGGITVNGAAVTGISPVSYGDRIRLADVDMTLLPVPAEERGKAGGKPNRAIKPSSTLFLLTLFQMLSALQLCMAEAQNVNIAVPAVFAALIAVMWGYYLFRRKRNEAFFEPEILAFFLTGLSLAVVSSSAPERLVRQFAAFCVGLVIFLVLSYYIKDLDRAKKARWLMAGGAIALLSLSLVLGRSINGAKNWISLFGMSVQPSELAKIAFIYAGSATLDRLYAKRNIYMFIGFSAVCIGALALMGDFGTAAVFFVTFLIIAFLRSGDYMTLSLICAVSGCGALLVFHFKPYIVSRFSAWGHVWNYASTTGYQQTRTLSAAASGGLLGMGGGNGWLRNVTAADADLVFGILCEEWGLIIALTAIAVIVCLAVYTVRSVKNARSTFYMIAACASASLLVFQTALNVLGPVDILPLTGVTFPFVSSGGTSMAAAWGLLAFLKTSCLKRGAKGNPPDSLRAPGGVKG